MTIVLSEQKIKAAQKDYDCDACEWVDGMCGGFPEGMTFAEKRAVIRAKWNRYKIKKGEPYIRQFNTDNGNGVWQFKAIPEIHDTCLKYDLYNES